MIHVCYLHYIILEQLLVSLLVFLVKDFFLIYVLCLHICIRNTQTTFFFNFSLHKYLIHKTNLHIIVIKKSKHK